MMFLFSETNMNNITVKNNIAYADSTGIFVTFSTISVSSSTFNTDSLPNGATSIEDASTLSYNLGCFISISAGSTVILTDNIFTNGYSVSGGHIYISGNSDVTINSCTFSEGYASSDGGAIYASGFKLLTIQDSTFTTHTAKRDGSDLYLSSGTTTLSGSNFTIKLNPSSIYVSSGNFTVSNIKVDNSDSSNTEILSGITGGFIYAANTDAFSIAASTFTDINFAERGGAIYISYLASLKGGSIPATPTFSISSSTFTNNVAIKGGAIYVDNVDHAQITTCTFIGNQAITESTITSGNGEGGAIYYASSGNPNDLTNYRCYFPVDN
jgi:predicted outer membrane repeat protein